jgi:predicted GNAT superfamily acetyltransferase
MLTGFRGTKSPVTIRDLTTVQELGKVQAVEREVWQLAEADLLPLTMAVATQAAGGIWVGAFDGDDLVGFAFGFIGRHRGQVIIHSHQLAVLAEYRDADLGYRLKLAQRDRALAMGIDQMNWTFDPLQSKNAYFNFAKLGVVSNTYKENFYGPETSSILHRNGTDRLWVEWRMNSPRVLERLERNAQEKSDGTAESTFCLLHSDGANRPVAVNIEEALAHQQILVGVPEDINAIQKNDPALAGEWRVATRWALKEAIGAGFLVTGFCRRGRGGKGPGAYLLKKANLEEFVSRGAPRRRLAIVEEQGSPGVIGCEREVFQDGEI